MIPIAGNYRTIELHWDIFENSVEKFTVSISIIILYRSSAEIPVYQSLLLLENAENFDEVFMQKIISYFNFTVLQIARLLWKPKHDERLWWRK